ncbi:MAG: hypothetical protein ABI406_14770 [Ktedonobacteraceae bacterium]
MRKSSLFKRWPRYFIILAILGIMLQTWWMGGHFPSMNMNTHTHILPPLKQSMNLLASSELEESKPPHMLRPNFQTGVVFPQWGKSGYGTEDTNWQTGLSNIQHQTAAQWVSMAINFSQAAPDATQVQVAHNTPTLQAVTSGIRLARTMGFHVFIQPLITIIGPKAWAGYIQFNTEQQAQAWFDSYWQTYEPYIAVAAQAGADELSLGDEYELLQAQWSPQWNQLIARAHTIFHGALTYDSNWTSLTAPEPSWMQNPLLRYIGVAVYIPLTDAPERLAPAIIPGLWREKIGKVLDAFSARLKKPVLISEIGYRNSPDALYQPWANQTLAGTDPAEQAAAYDAALQNALVDPHIAGIFFWAWSFPPFQPNEEPASRELYRWYTSPLA